jgi:hypothetical protein
MELNFQKIVLAVSIIVFIVVLVFIGLALRKANKEKTWPPIVGSCPDYWEDTGNGCYNKMSLGKCNIPTADDKNLMKFNVPPYNSSDGACAKAKWAKDCGIEWDGISQVTNCSPPRKTN